jgi:predicted HicB family RNase H-like nuclease
MTNKSKGRMDVTQQFNVRIDKSILTNARKYANASGIRLGSIVELAITAYLKAKKF